MKYDPAAELCLVAQTNTAFVYRLQYENTDITSWTISMKVKDKVGTLILTPTVAATDAANGFFEVTVPLAQMGAVAPGGYLYDLIYQIGAGEPIPLLYGGFLVKQGIT